VAPIANPEAWLFRIAHNAALDFLRRRARRSGIEAEEDPEMIADAVSAAEQQEIAAASLRTFARLPVTQRSAVILMDVLGYSLAEIGTVTGSTVPAIKAALHRGRTGLREFARAPEDRREPSMSETERAQLAAYVDRFNARDFDAVRDMLADEVRLELVARTELKGRREVERYFTNYGAVRDWHLVPGFVDERPAVLVRDPAGPATRPSYFILLEWAGGHLARIRDFRHARYAAESAELLRLDV
jgi:RNA polymerase sigma-70 factor (ECF subfamily)